MKVSGAEQVIKNFSKFEKKLVDEIVAGCEAVQQNVVNAARERVPYITGNLYGSIQAGGIVIDDTNITALVGANAPYAGFVEGVDSNWKPLEGWTRKITPFLGPSVLENISTFRKAMAAAVKRAELAI